MQLPQAFGFYLFNELKETQRRIALKKQTESAGVNE